MRWETVCPRPLSKSVIELRIELNPSEIQDHPLNNSMPHHIIPSASLDGHPLL